MDAWLSYVKEKARSARANVGAGVNQANEGLDQLRVNAVRGARGLIRESERIDNEGTALRSLIKATREQVNATTVATYVTCSDISGRAETHLLQLREQTAWLIDAAVPFPLLRGNLPTTQRQAKADETRRNKPEVLVGAATLLTAAFSALGVCPYVCLRARGDAGSRRRLIGNTLSAAIATSVQPSSWPRRL